MVLCMACLFVLLLEISVRERPWGCSVTTLGLIAVLCLTMVSDPRHETVLSNLPLVAAIHWFLTTFALPKSTKENVDH